MKSITVSANELTDDIQIQCTLTGTSPAYGSVDVNDSFIASHTRGEADSNDTLSIEDGALFVTTDDDNYRLSGNELKALYPRLNGTVTANAWIYHTQPLKTIEFKYNSAGLRVQKKVTANGKTEVTDYTLHGKLVTHMTVGNDKLHFFYDAQSRPMKVNFNGTTYIYLHNLQGDVVGIIDNGGNLVVKYKYDAWGRSISITGLLAATLGTRNPFRYRGYIYDEETELYYLRSRYYNPLVGRFVNSDILIGKVEAVLTNNVFFYCLNNPMCTVDSDGTWPSWSNIINAVAIAVTTVVVAAAVIATAGAAGAAIGVAAGMYLGTSAAASVAIGTVATCGAYCVAGGVIACGANDAVTELTGTNLIANEIGQENYEVLRTGIYVVAGASVATSEFGYEPPHKKVVIDRVGRLVPANHPDEGYYGVRYRVYKPYSDRYSLRSFEFHTHDHRGYNPHWQLNNWNPRTMTVSGKKYWTWYFRRIK